MLYTLKEYTNTHTIYIYLLHTFPAHCIFPITRSVSYLPIFLTFYFTLHYAHILNNVVLTTVVEMVEKLDGRVGKRSVEQVRYVINYLLHLVIVKY